MPFFAVAGATALSGILGAVSSSNAADASASAANNSSANTLAQYRENVAREQPFVDAGRGAINNLTGINENLDAGALGTAYSDGVAPNQTNYVSWADIAQPKETDLPGAFTLANLESTPGYQFTLSQGLKSTQNAAAARGLGVSGAALKGAAAYATGLSDQTYNQRFADQQQIFNDKQTRSQDYLNFNSAQQGNIGNAQNRLLSTATLGQNAASQTGAQGVQSAQTSGNFLTAAGNAQAAGALGIGSSIGSSLTNAGNQYLQQQQFNQLYGAGGIYGAPTNSGSPIVNNASG